MSQSPGLALYLFARSRLAGLLGGVRTATAAADDSRQRIGQPDQPRPAGGLIWFNAPSATALRALAELLRSIREERSNIAFVVTTPSGMDATGSDLPRGTVFQTAPLDAVPFARAFLDHWKPDVAVFLEGSLPAALIDQTHARKIPLFLIDGRSEVSGSGWFRRTFGMTKSLLQRFDRILVQDPLTARQFRRMGAPPWRLETAGKMEESTGALPCTEAERDAMARLMRSRPVWLAVTVPQVEESAVLSAFKMALNLSHRLLLIIVPEDAAGGPALADLIAQDHGLNVSLRSRDEEPDE